MDINVSVNKICIANPDILNSGEAYIHKLKFNFSEEYTPDLVYRACFTCLSGTFVSPILNNECEIPPEALEADGTIELGVYAYILEDDTLEKRFSPEHLFLTINAGSYREGLESEAPTPTEQEQWLNAFNENYLEKVAAAEDAIEQAKDEAIEEAKDDINTARTGALDDIVLEKNSAVSAINSAKTDALGELNDSKESAINEIEDLNNGLKTRVASLESGKVDKEAGKQLSDENYTLAEKNKLAGLENYDDTNIRAALAGKVDKAEGKGLSTNDYTNEEKQKLADTASGLASLLNRFNDYSDFDSFVERYILMRKTGEIFGTLFKPFEESHLSTGERTGASIGKHITPATDTTPEDTNFPEWLTKPLFVCNGHLTDDGEFVIDAIKGRDSNFADTGAVDVFNCYQTCYWAFDNTNGDHYRMSDSYFEGSHVVPMAIRKDGSIRPYFPIAKYQATEVNGKLYSSKGKPFRNNSYANCVNNYHKKGPYYSAMLNCEYMYFQFLFAILFADRNNETHLRGNTNNNFQYNVAYGEENVSRVVLTTAQAANIDLYSFVSVGNMGTATNKDRGQAYIHNILDDVQVIGKEVIDENNTALILDCDPVTITENALVSTMHEWSGFSDRILGNTGSVISNTNGKHGAVLCGTELMVGGHEVMGNAIADIIDSNFTRDIYISNDGSKLVTTAATIKTTYEKSEFQFRPVAAAWKYITAMVYDLIMGLPVFNSSGESGSGSATGYCDATTCDNGTSGQRELLRGGNLSNGGVAGLWCLNLGITLSFAHWGCLSRPSVNAVGGELSE